jgi:tetratricopeptide (TPR) repeat protein
MQMQKASFALSLAVVAAVFVARPAMADMTFSPGVGLAIDAENALRDDKPEKSIQIGERALKTMDLPPSFSAYVLNNMCVAYTQITRFEMAIETCDKALKYDADDWRFLNNHANALLGMGNADGAIADYTTALKDRPDNAILKDNLEVAKKYKYYGGVPLSFSQRRLRL